MSSTLMPNATGEADYYALIGIAPDAAPEEIRRAYGERIRDAMNDQERFAALAAAFEVLKDPQQRAEYDQRRQQRFAATNATIQKEPTRMSTQMPPPPPATGGDATVAMPPSSGQTLQGGAAFSNQTMSGGRTQAFSLPPCPVCGTPGVPGEEFCMECGFLVGSVAGEESEQRPLPRLIDNVGREFPLHLGENTVGREGSDIMLPDRTVSRRHARIVVEQNGTVWVEDMGSTNGSRVAAAPLPAGRQTSLRDKTPVQFGSVKLTVLLPEGFERELLMLPAPTTTPAEAPVAALAAPAEYGSAEASAARLLGKDGSTHVLTGTTTTLGRRSGNSIILTGDAFISGNHAEIVYDDGRFRVTDLGSTNGTKLNGRRLTPQAPQPLADGDELTLGQTAFTFHAPAGS